MGGLMLRGLELFGRAAPHCINSSRIAADTEAAERE
jgi:hypothetical protein